jgi:DNA repair protein RecO
MTEQHSLALILKCTPYGEQDKIIMLFTPHLGKISAYAKASSFLQPLSLIETIIQTTKSDLFRIKDLKLLDSHLSLRETFPSLKASLQIADFTVRFFPERVEKPHIFALLTLYLQKMAALKKPENIFYSFFLKTLHIEGLIDVEELPSHLMPLALSRKWAEIDAIDLSEEEKSSILFLEQKF